MALLDLLGRRWTLRVIWELRDAPLLFRELQARCEGMSSSVLNQRLQELRGVEVGAADLPDLALLHLPRDADPLVYHA